MFAYRTRGLAARTMNCLRQLTARRSCRAGFHIPMVFNITLADFPLALNNYVQAKTRPRFCRIA